MSRTYHWRRRCPEHPDAAAALSFSRRHVGPVCVRCGRPLEGGYATVPLAEWVALGKPRQLPERLLP